MPFPVSEAVEASYQLGNSLVSLQSSEEKDDLMVIGYTEVTRLLNSRQATAQKYALLSSGDADREASSTVFLTLYSVRLRLYSLRRD